MGKKKITARSMKKKGPSHPNSRRAFQLNRIAHRENKLAQAKSAREKARTAKVDRIMTFILLLPPEKARLPDLYSLHDFIQTFFLSRHNDELERLQKEQRPGRPMNKHLGELKALIDNEMNEYREGMEVPDLCNETNVALLREWEGDPQALPTFRFVRVSGSDREMCDVTQPGSHKLLQEQPP